MKHLFLGISALASVMLMADDVSYENTISSDEVAILGRNKPTKKKKNEAPRPFYYDQNSSEFFVYGDWIYWTPVTKDPMNYAQNRSEESSNLAPNITDQKLKYNSLNYGFSSGFRVGTGFRFGQNTLQTNIRPWQIEANYIRLHAHATDSVKAPDDVSTTGFVIENSISPLVPTVNATDATTAHSHSKLFYDRINLQFAWPMWITPSVILRLMVGGSFAWIENDWKSHFAGPLNDINIVEKTDLKWRWWGGGLLGAGDIYMGVGSGFGFFANSSFALLFGPMHEKERYTNKSIDATNVVTADNVQVAKFKFNAFQPIVNLGVGIDYKHWFKDKVMLQLALGWEFTWLFDMNQFGRINEHVSGLKGSPSERQPTTNNLFNNEPSDLGFHGLTARLGLDF